MYFSSFELFLWAVTLMVVLFFAYFSLKAIFVYYDFRKNISNILLGSLIAGCGSGAVLAILTNPLFPTYECITEQSEYAVHKESKVLNSKFLNEHGKTYIANLTSSRCFLVQCSVDLDHKDSNKNQEDYTVEITSNSVVEKKNEIVEWFDSSEAGREGWHVLSEEQLLDEIKHTLDEIEAYGIVNGAENQPELREDLKKWLYRIDKGI